MNITVTLLLQSIAFLVMIWLVKRFMWGPILTALEARQKRIEDGLAAAEQGHQASAQAATQAESLIAEAKQQAHEILNQTNKRCKAIEEEASIKAQQKSEKIIANAKQELDQQVYQASEQLRKELGGIIIDGVRQIIGKEVNATTHKQIIDDLSKKLS